MKPIRVLQVLGGLNRGGAETMIMNLYRAIDKAEVQFDFVIHNEDENAYVDEIKSLGGKVYVFPQFTFKNYFSYRRYWDAFLREHKEYKILHSHVRSYAIFFIRIAKKKGLKTIVHSHSTSNGSGLKARIKSVLQLPLRKESDYLFACSKISGEWLFGKKAIHSLNYRMIKNAIDTNRYRVDAPTRNEYRKQFGATNRIVYGHIGRLSEPKNHRFLLEIFKDIKRKAPDSLLMIVGEGSYRPQIELWIHELDLAESVVMTGARSDIPQLLSAMDVFLFPSLWEGLPVTVVEAQAAGLPCLVSDKVTSEVAVSKAVTYLPIENGTECWVDCAISSIGKRYDVIDDIKSAGFDVNNSAMELIEVYRSIYSI